MGSPNRQSVPYCLIGPCDWPIGGGRLANGSYWRTGGHSTAPSLNPYLKRPCTTAPIFDEHWNLLHFGTPDSLYDPVGSGVFSPGIWLGWEDRGCERAVEDDDFDSWLALSGPSGTTFSPVGQLELEYEPEVLFDNLNSEPEVSGPSIQH
jgi:hypothetical protein